MFFLTDFNETISTDCRKILKSNFVKIRQVGAEFFHVEILADGRTDGHDEANSRFLNFVKASKNKIPIRIYISHFTK